MTDEEKGALLQFMGTAYGDAHKQDQNIVGKSGQLQPISQHMKQEFEEVFNTPTHPHPQNALAPVPVQGPVASGPPGPPTGPISPVTVEQATKELNTAPPELQFDSNTVTHSQLEFDLTAPSKLDDLITLVKKTNLLLKEISLKLDNGKTAKTGK